MPLFFIKASQIEGRLCRIAGEDFHHLARVRRVAIGDRLGLRDEKGMEYGAVITAIGEGLIEAEIIMESEAAAVPLVLDLYLCVLKGKNFDLALQKTVEAGVSSITPVISERTVRRPDVSGGAESRWRRIAVEASKQSLRCEAALRPITEFNKVLSEDRPGTAIIAHPSAAESFGEYSRRAGKPESAGLLVGPEGGFSDREIKLAEEHGWVPLSFGPTQLRAETAAMIVPSIVLYEWGWR
jgi:16S rRNA (uracil1498-N3)-methyltransferase